MKEVIVISKAHLDLGFTDYSKNIKEKYIKEFIPAAIKLSDELNTKSDKKFVWTLGSWIVKEALDCSDEKSKEKLLDALKKGNVVAHALPFTTHTELLDDDLLDYGLSIVDTIDGICNKKTISSKMTDVPGHTKALVPALANHGIKLLHIGINGAAAVAKVEPVFLWKYQDKEVVVIYDNGYGGVLQVPFTDKILYFDHAYDNGGVRNKKSVLNKLAQIQKEYEGYKVRAGSLDDIAQALWEVKDKLPCFEGEIGDTWIHGVATDPYKTAAYRSLCSLKTKWLNEGSLDKSSEEYKVFADNLMCVAEHTWGLDMKTHLADTENYEKEKFIKARQKNKVYIKHLFNAFPFSFLGALYSTLGLKEYSYSSMERSWEEQREYVANAIKALSKNHYDEAQEVLLALRPKTIEVSNFKEKYEYNSEICIDKYKLSINDKGGISLSYQDKKIFEDKNSPFLTYRSYGNDDYLIWENNYLRSKVPWAISDYLRPSLKKHNNYKQGLFEYYADNAFIKKNKSEINILLNMKCDDDLCVSLGAPKNVSIKYTLSKAGLKIKLIWTDKDAVRTTESIATHFYPTSNDVLYYKIGKSVDPKDVVFNGGRKLSCVEKVSITKDEETFDLQSIQAPLVASDGGDILCFDNKEANFLEKGISYVLFNNVWGTNFPLWYEENALFEFEIKRK